MVKSSASAPSAMSRRWSTRSALVVDHDRPDIVDLGEVKAAPRVVAGALLTMVDEGDVGPVVHGVVAGDGRSAGRAAAKTPLATPAVGAHQALVGGVEVVADRIVLVVPCSDNIHLAATITIRAPRRACTIHRVEDHDEAQQDACRRSTGSGRACRCSSHPHTTEVAQLGDDARALAVNLMPSSSVGLVACNDRRRRVGRPTLSHCRSARSVTVIASAWVTGAAVPSLTLTVTS